MLKKSIYIVTIIVVLGWLWFGYRALPEVTKVTMVTSKAPVVTQPKPQLAAPLSRALERITKKKFGTYVTPSNSPVSPERFSGYHTGVDFETFPEEAKIDVPVLAVCGGVVRLRQWVGGYGGVVVADCVLDNQPVTVTYGHLRINSVANSFGENLIAGDTIGDLGTGYTAETDGERKHLHLGIHKGDAINLLGYVDSVDLLGEYLDPQTLLQ